MEVKVVKVKVECDDCGFIFKVPLTPYKSTLYGDDIYLDSNCPRCDCWDLKTVKEGQQSFIR